MTSSTVPSVTAAGTSPAGLIAEFERRLAGIEPLNWYGERFKALSRDERLSLYKRCSVNEFAALYLSAGNYKAEAELATRPCECFHRCGDVCKCFNTLKAARVASEHAPAPEPVQEPIQEEVSDSTPEVVVAIIDRIAQVLVNMVREEMRAGGPSLLSRVQGLASTRARSPWTRALLGQGFNCCRAGPP